MRDNGATYACRWRVPRKTLMDALQSSPSSASNRHECCTKKPYTKHVFNRLATWKFIFYLNFNFISTFFDREPRKPAINNWKLVRKALFMWKTKSLTGKGVQIIHSLVNQYITFMTNQPFPPCFVTPSQGRSQSKPWMDAFLCDHLGLKMLTANTSAKETFQLTFRSKRRWST